jgi:serine/threonine protein kinase
MKPLSKSPQRYQPVEILSRSSRSQVQLAYFNDASGSRQACVLKSSTDKDRLQREAETLAQLHHDSLPTLIHLAPDRSFLVEEYVDGTSFKEILHSGSRQLWKVWLVHGNLDASQVLVTFAGQVKLIDFSDCAQIGTETTTIHLRSASPNRLRHKRADAQDDIFALGLMLWQIAAERPYWEDAASDEAIEASLAKFEAKDLPSDDIPPGFGHIVRTCLSTDYYRSYPDAESLLKELLTLQNSITGQPDVSAFLIKEFPQSLNRSRERMRHANALGVAAAPAAQPEPAAKLSDRWLERLKRIKKLVP